MGSAIGVAGASTRYPSRPHRPLRWGGADDVDGVGHRVSEDLLDPAVNLGQQQAHLGRPGGGVCPQDEHPTLGGVGRLAGDVTGDISTDDRLPVRLDTTGGHRLRVPGIAHPGVDHLACGPRIPPIGGRGTALLGSPTGGTSRRGAGRGGRLLGSGFSPGAGQHPASGIVDGVCHLGGALRLIVHVGSPSPPPARPCPHRTRSPRSHQAHPRPPQQ